MKKIVMIIMLLVLTTGCSKKLVCEKITEEDIITTTETLMVGYQNDSVKNIQIDLKAALKKKYDTYAETVENKLKEQFKKYENIKGISVTSTSNDHIVNVHLYIKLDEMKEKDKNELKLINLKENYNQLKKTLEKEKYQCQ